MNANEVYREVERRKERAKKLGVNVLITKLYFDSIQYYPSWIKRDAVCSLITNAIELETEKIDDKRWKKIKIVLKGKEYIFAFEEHSFSVEGDYFHHGTIELYANDKKLLILDVSCDYGEYTSEWRSFGIIGFIEGDWIQDFKDLQKKIESEEQERKRKEREDPKKINDLKKSFGI